MSVAQRTDSPRVGRLRTAMVALGQARTPEQKRTRWDAMVRHGVDARARVEELDAEIAKLEDWLGRADTYLGRNPNDEHEQRWLDELSRYERLCDERHGLRKALAEAEVML